MALNDNPADWKITGRKTVLEHALNLAIASALRASKGQRPDFAEIHQKEYTELVAMKASLEKLDPPKK